MSRLSLLGLAGAIAVVFAAGDEPRVSVSVYPGAAQRGGSVYVTCRAPRNPENRKLSFGVPGLKMSDRQVDGEAGPGAVQMTADHLECLHPTEAVCVLTTSSGRTWRDARPIAVLGCDSPGFAGPADEQASRP